MRSKTLPVFFVSASLIAAHGAFAARPHLRPPAPPTDSTTIAEFRSVDGTGNNKQHPEWGSAGSIQARILPPAYGDGRDAPAGSDRPGARAVSNSVCTQTGAMPNRGHWSDMFWQWGQFVDHDIVLTAGSSPAEAFDIEVPTGDPYFDPASTGTRVIPFSRSYHEVVRGVRQQVNEISSFVDASQVYGSDEATALSLRMLDGSGRMKTSDGDLLPVAEDGYFYAAGDVRANEQIALTSLHTLFVREHNYWAGEIGRRSRPAGVGVPPPPPIPGLPTVPGPLSDEKIYQLARTMVAAEMQAITYREYLPVLLGDGALRPYAGYKPNVDPSIWNEFSAAAYRYGHSMLSDQFLRLDAQNRTIVQGNIALADAFFAPAQLRATGIDPLLRGLAFQRAQELDPFLVDGVRNFLFGAPGSGGFDLASLNIQRGRDHGLPSYNRLRTAMGGRPARTFADITRDAALAGQLADVYGSPDQVDAWVGLLAEDDLRGKLVGPTMFAILKRQFEALRDGDRFWYQNQLPPETRRLVERQTLAGIIRRNTAIGDEIQDDVFVAPAN